jgi:hypothetical protein
MLGDRRFRVRFSAAVYIFLSSAETRPDMGFTQPIECVPRVISWELKLAEREANLSYPHCRVLLEDAIIIRATKRQMVAT